MDNHPKEVEVTMMVEASMVVKVTMVVEVRMVMEVTKVVGSPCDHCGRVLNGGDSHQGGGGQHGDRGHQGGEITMISR